MTSTTALIHTLSEALGLPHSAVDWTARALREGGLFPVGKGGRGGAGAAGVTVQHAVNLLLALMAPQSSKSVKDRVDLYNQLPFEGVTRSELMPDGRFETVPLADDDPFVESIRAGSATFSKFLQSFIGVFNEAPEMDTTPGGIFVGGGAGNAFASVQLSVLADGVDVGGSIRFSLAPAGGGRHPDDAPLARLDNYNTVPGSIFRVFRDLLAGDSEGPREVVMSRARVAELCEGRQ